MEGEWLSSLALGIIELSLSLQLSDPLSTQTLPSGEEWEGRVGGLSGAGSLGVFLFSWTEAVFRTAMERAGSILISQNASAFGKTGPVNL